MTSFSQDNVNVLASLFYSGRKWRCIVNLFYSLWSIVMNGNKCIFLSVTFCHLFQRFAPFPAAPIVCVLLGVANVRRGGRGPPVTNRRAIQSVKSMESAETDSVSVSPVGRESAALLVCQNDTNCIILLCDIITQYYI